MFMLVVKEDLRRKSDKCRQTNTGYQIFLGRQSGRGRFHPRPSPSAVSLHSAGRLSGLRSPNGSPRTF